jgi:hypothetical protein
MLVLEHVLSVLLTMVTILFFAAVLVAFYQQSKFIDEWLQDHAASISITRRWRLIPAAIFSTSLSERCRRRRYSLLLVWSALFVLMAIELLVIWALRVTGGVE